MASGRSIVPGLRYDKLYANAGNPGKAAEQIRHHFRAVFRKDWQPEQVDEFELLLFGEAYAKGDVAVPFTEPDLVDATTSLRMNKTSGCSGLSNEFLLALAEHEQGRHVLLDFVSGLLLQGVQIDAMQESFIVLIPKVRDVLKSSQFRPISLLESVSKLYCKLLTKRLQRAMHLPQCQHGGLPGGQVLEALAQAMLGVAAESLSGNPAIWISMDIAPLPKLSTLFRTRNWRGISLPWLPLKAWLKR